MSDVAQQFPDEGRDPHVAESQDSRFVYDHSIPVMAHLPRYPLGDFPTPLRQLQRLSQELGGPQISLKRDDLTGLSLGGNKTRKLEYLVADAMRQGADTLITIGGVQSNHCAQTAAAARNVGMECHLVLGGADPGQAQGNLLLDQFFDAKPHFVDKSERLVYPHELAAELRAEGRTPYIIPIGGSNGMGALGFVRAVFELQLQLQAAAESDPDLIFVATSSGGTQAGLELGVRLAGMDTQVIGMSVDQEKLGEDTPFQDELAEIANEAAQLLGASERLTAKDFSVNYDYLGEYGQMRDHEREAIYRLARSEGLIVDPVYTGRAFGGLIDMIEQGKIARDKTVVFVHTGGGAANFAYAEEF